MLLSRRDIDVVRHHALVHGLLQPPDADLEEIVEALREEVRTLRAQLSELRTAQS
ncbi:hypothetical protein DVA67_030505 [Solirubrobacter sp. CPCC 204708]|uniref:Uncharacterized protein n=1 Tax=Solirubrobacter deserti TaxID=2282478 RepID=A0ABT4RI97_9ACTN|nr:hypothetical protein [Solirubrobacter deserti]MBE2320335.1 hypothetical protein [Solirubrobacter deserti]MDA0138282.1 hypothetical protein [Solirubrobacter deserti]